MPQVNMHEAKTQLSKLVEAIESGRESEITIQRNGKPAARLVAIATPAPKRRLGLAKGRFHLDYDAFQALDGDVKRSFDIADPSGDHPER